MFVFAELRIFFNVSKLEGLQRSLTDVGGEMRQDRADRFTGEVSHDEEQARGVEGNVETSYDQNVYLSDDSGPDGAGLAAGT